MNSALFNIIVFAISYIVSLPIFLILFSRLADEGKLDKVFDKMDKVADRLNPKANIKEKLEKFKFVFKAIEDPHYSWCKISTVHVYINIGYVLSSKDSNTLDRFFKKRGYKLKYTHTNKIESFEGWLFGDEYIGKTTLEFVYKKGGE